jgi:predicted small lipoprotein YifL
LKPLAALAGAALLLLAGCGAKPLELPADPVDRAATCGVVAAATARTSVPDVKAPLPLAAQGKIFHYALLAASEGGEFRAETANRVNKRMGELQEGITSGKWRDLAPACAAAFPAAEKTEVALPEARLDAQLDCEELAEFTSLALEGSEVHYGNELAAYRRMRSALNDTLAPGLRARAGGRLEAQTAERKRALAAAAKLGSPMAVLDKCVGRFP